MNLRINLVTVIRWLARGLAIGLFLLWGAFFVEHLREWYITPFPNHPPFKVGLMMALHGALLAGLLLACRWELTGSLIVIASAFAFFSRCAGTMFLPFFFVTASPALLLLWCWWRTRGISAPPDSQASVQE